ncbi:hypothetical protein G6F63_016385 [Rhizopus arrhizus]|nr:hypothetical protein G6F63_016385 [Rhizopus arrhizus]
MMRSFWYGRSNQNQASGATAATPPTPRPTHPHGRPASSSTNTPLAAISTPVPKSGCSITSPVGTPMITSATSTVLKRGGSGIRCRYQATIIGRLTFSRSAGCR